MTHHDIKNPDSSAKKEDLDKLEQTIDIKIDSIKERIRDFMMIFAAVGGIYTFFLIGSYINNSFERKNLQESFEKFEKETRNELLGELEEEAEIKILGKNNQPLQEQIIEIDKLFISKYNNANLTYKVPRYRISYSITFKNVGRGVAKDAVLKTYWTQDLAGDFSNSPNVSYSTDEPDFDYEVIEYIGNGPISKLKLNMSYSNTNGIWRFGEFKPGTYPIKTKIYYGEDKIVESTYNIKIPANVEIIEIYDNSQL